LHLPGWPMVPAAVGRSGRVVCSYLEAVRRVADSVVFGFVVDCLGKGSGSGDIAGCSAVDNAVEPPGCHIPPVAAGTSVGLGSLGIPLGFGHIVLAACGRGGQIPDARHGRDRRDGIAGFFAL